MKLFITTSGIGSRLLDLTKYTNKAMIKIGKRPVISYIIDAYPKDFDLVISLGYHGDHVKQYLSMAYPDRNITYVEVDRYEGEGTSQVYSQLHAEKYLQEPFIYNDCDTIVENLQNQIPMNFNYNFIVGYETNSDLYDSFDYDVSSKASDGSYKLINTYARPNSLAGMLAYIGIAGIYDYKTFWKTLHIAYENDDWKKLSDFFVYDKYKMFNDLRAIKVDNWIDTGSIAGVNEARKKISDKFLILDKNDQGIFMINNKVIKFFARDGVVDNLMKHYKSIEKFCTPIVEYSKNFISYNFIDAEDAIDNMTPIKFNEMLNYFNKEGLWEDKNYLNIDKFYNEKNKFYIDKTKERLKDLIEKYKIDDNKDIYINDVFIPKEYSIENMLTYFSKTNQYATYHKLTNWHGDFVLDNMLYDYKNNKYILLDWREKFGSFVEYGDRIYDFAKMNHNLTFNFKSACNGLFNINEIDDNKVYVNILCNNYVHECKDILKEFLLKNYHLDFNYIEFLTGLCWVNMSPLHGQPMCKLLYYMGKLTMYQSLKKLIKK